MPWGVVSASSPVNTPIGVWNGNVPLHEWNSGREWKGDGWQHYELDLRTWVFEEESYVPMALLLNGEVYSIVTDQIGRYISEKPIRFASGTLPLHSYVEDVNSWVDVLGLSKLHKLRRFHGKKPQYTNPRHHDPSSKNFRGGGSKTSILPQNAEDIYRVSIPDGSRKHWYAKSQDGTIHRFGNSNDGTVHWNGSTNSPRGIIVPPEVLKRFNDEGYTPAPNATYKKK